MNNKMKLMMMAGLLAVATGTAGSAYAATDSTQVKDFVSKHFWKQSAVKQANATTEGTDATTAPDDGSELGNPGFGGPDGDFKGHGGHGFGGPGFGGPEFGGHMPMMVKFDDGLFKLLNISQDDFHTQLESGKSLAEIATAQGVAEQKVIDYLVEQRTKEIDQAVANEDLTKKVADKMKATLADMTKQMVERKMPAPPDGKFGGKMDMKIIINDDLFKLLKLDGEKFREQMDAGKTLAEIATAQGVSEQTVIDFFVAQRTTDLDKQVADGKLTQAQADEIKKTLPDMTKQFVEGKGHPGGKGGPGKRIMIKKSPAGQAPQAPQASDVQ